MEKMEDILLYLVVGLIILGYIIIFVAYMANNGKKNKETGYDLAFKLLEKNNSTKIVEGKNLFFSEYNVQRDAIRLSNRSYNNSDNFSLFVGSLMAGYALEKRNGSLEIMRKLFKNYHFMSFSSLLIIVLVFLSNTVSDAKIGVLLFIVILFYQYLFFDFGNKATLKIKDNVRDTGVKKLLNLNVKINLLFMVATVIGIIRLILILFVK